MLCACGCGKETIPYPRTSGVHKKGDQQKYLRGHWARGRRTKLPFPNPSGICQCGCGRPAPRASMTNERIGHVQGEHVRFIRGHVGNLAMRNRIGDDQWHLEDRNYETPCYIWNADPIGPTGYCRVRLERKDYMAHRAMYEQEVGQIPEGLQIDHLCREPSCVRPDHLEPVTPATNVRRGKRARLTEESVLLIRASKLSARELAAIFGVSCKHITAVRNGHVWRDL